ncbi:MAG: fibronectin type III domain-containing protein [Nitrospira sp.]|nr:fibronectin type III domain-containing protein [Nitrospira sp.]
MNPFLRMNTSATTNFQKSIIGLACSVTLSILFLSLSGCGSGDAGEPTISTASTASGATASLAWDPVQPQAGEPSILGYYIHYGRQSAGQRGSCSYEDSVFVMTSAGTIRRLEAGTRYYFAVSAYNGVEGTCSNEVFIDT